uniref:Uncharacterized protein n=1 Tax=Rhizophora mucronata TaxID=61149 RepID=A0A2P2PML8_RHIMU
MIPEISISLMLMCSYVVICMLVSNFLTDSMYLQREEM